MFSDFLFIWFPSFLVELFLGSLAGHQPTQEEPRWFFLARWSCQEQPDVCRSQGLFRSLSVMWCGCHFSVVYFVRMALSFLSHILDLCSCHWLSKCHLWSLKKKMALLKKNSCEAPWWCTKRRSIQTPPSRLTIKSNSTLSFLNSSVYGFASLRFVLSLFFLLTVLFVVMCRNPFKPSVVFALMISLLRWPYPNRSSLLERWHTIPVTPR